MKKKTLLIAALLFACGISVAADVQLQPTSDANIEFTAEALMTVPNDLATIYLSARADNSNLAIAQSTVNSTMDNAINALKQVSSKIKIQNMGYSTRPIYPKPKEGEISKIAGWEATQRIMVSTEDLKEVALLVQTAQDADLGLTSINFSLTKETLAKTNEKLIEQVVEETNKKAADIAKAMKLPVESFFIDKMEFDYSGRPADRVIPISRLAAAPNSVALPNFESGTTDVSKRIHVALKIKDKNK